MLPALHEGVIRQQIRDTACAYDAGAWRVSFFVHNFEVAYTFRGGTSNGRRGMLPVQVVMLGRLR